MPSILGSILVPSQQVFGLQKVWVRFWFRFGSILGAILDFRKFGFQEVCAIGFLDFHSFRSLGFEEVCALGILDFRNLGFPRNTRKSGHGESLI